MHHLTSGINFQIHFVSTSHVMIHLLIHLSTHLCHHRHYHPSLLHFFTAGSKPTFSTNPSHLNILLYSFDAFTIMGLDRTYHAHQFTFGFSFTFLFIPCSKWDWTGPITLTSLLLVFLLHFCSFRVVNGTGPDLSRSPVYFWFFFYIFVHSV